MSDYIEEHLMRQTLLLENIYGEIVRIRGAMVMDAARIAEVVGEAQAIMDGRAPPKVFKVDVPEDDEED